MNFNPSHILLALTCFWLHRARWPLCCLPCFPSLSPYGADWGKAKERNQQNELTEQSEREEKTERRKERKRKEKGKWTNHFSNRLNQSTAPGSRCVRVWKCEKKQNLCDMHANSSVHTSACVANKHLHFFYAFGLCCRGKKNNDKTNTVPLN